MFVKWIQQETGTRVQIKGQGSGFIETDTGRESDDPLHVNIACVSFHSLLAALPLLTHVADAPLAPSRSGPDQAQIDRAAELARDLLKVVGEKHTEAREALNSYGGGGGGGGGGQFTPSGANMQQFGAPMRFGSGPPPEQMGQMGQHQQQHHQHQQSPYNYQVRRRSRSFRTSWAALADDRASHAAEPVRRRRPHRAAPAERSAARRACDGRRAGGRTGCERLEPRGLHGVVAVARSGEQGLLHAVRPPFLSRLCPIPCARRHSRSNFPCRYYAAYAQYAANPSAAATAAATPAAPSEPAPPAPPSDAPPPPPPSSAAPPPPPPSDAPPAPPQGGQGRYGAVPPPAGL